MNMTLNRTTTTKPDYNATRRAVLKLRAINHPLRRRIIIFLSGHKTATVTQIYVWLRVEQSVASQHLAILRAQGFVQTERVGQHIRYRLDTWELDRCTQIISELAKLYQR